MIKYQIHFILFSIAKHEFINSFIFQKIFLKIN